MYLTTSGEMNPLAHYTCIAPDAIRGVKNGRITLIPNGVKPNRHGGTVGSTPAGVVCHRFCDPGLHPGLLVLIRLRRM